jgi:hypothetical protein
MSQDVQRHLESAEGFLRESEYLFSGGFFRGTIGRAYYAMFHAATALLLHEGIERSSHHAIISAFGEHIAKPGLVDATFHKHFVEAFTLRNDCDYLAPFKPEKSQAQTTLQRAKEFVATCRQLCL